MRTANGLDLFASPDVNTSDVCDLIRGASERSDVRRNSCVLQLKQKLLWHPSGSPVLYLPERFEHAQMCSVQFEDDRPAVRRCWAQP